MAGADSTAEILAGLNLALAIAVLVAVVVARARSGRSLSALITTSLTRLWSHEIGRDILLFLVVAGAAGLIGFALAWRFIPTPTQTNPEVAARLEQIDQNIAHARTWVDRLQREIEKLSGRLPDMEATIGQIAVAQAEYSKILDKVADDGHSALAELGLIKQRLTGLEQRRLLSPSVYRLGVDTIKQRINYAENNIINDERNLSKLNNRDFADLKQILSRIEAKIIPPRPPPAPPSPPPVPPPATARLSLYWASVDALTYQISVDLQNLGEKPARIHSADIQFCPLQDQKLDENNCGKVKQRITPAAATHWFVRRTC